MTLSLDVEVDTSAFEAFLLAAETSIVEELARTLEGAGAMVARTAIQTRSFKDRDVRLRPTIRRGEVHFEEGNVLSIEVLAGSSEVHYAGYIEFGTKTITARRFMRDALAEHEREIGELLALAVERGFERAQRGAS